jgi:hypothetical protein
VERKRLEVEEDPDRWAPPVSGEKEKKRNRKGERKRFGWLLGWLGWIGPRVGPVGLSSLFFVLNLFLFLISYFLHRFCITASNQIKPISNLF